MINIKKIFLGMVLVFSSVSCSSFYIKTLDVVTNNILKNKDNTYERYMNYYYTNENKIYSENEGYSLEYKEVKGVKYITYKKDNVKTKNLLIYVHGGAFYRTNVYQENLRLVHNVMQKTNKDFEVIFLDYKGDVYPKQSEELEILLKSVEKKYKKIILMGDSSGGNIIFSNTLKRRDEKRKMPNAIIALSPWLDTSNSVKSRYTNFKNDVLMGKSMYNKLLLDNPYLEGQDLENPYVSPVYAKYHRFPKTLLQYGGREILRDDSIIVCNKINKAKSFCQIEEYPNMIHVFQLYDIFDETVIALTNIARFIDNIF